MHPLGRSQVLSEKVTFVECIFVVIAGCVGFNVRVGLDELRWRDGEVFCGEFDYFHWYPLRFLLGGGGCSGGGGCIGIVGVVEERGTALLLFSLAVGKAVRG